MSNAIDQRRPKTTDDDGFVEETMKWTIGATAFTVFVLFRDALVETIQEMLREMGVTKPIVTLWVAFLVAVAILSIQILILPIVSTASKATYRSLGWNATAATGGFGGVR